MSEGISHAADERDAGAAAIAARQHGNVTYEQLTTLGFNASAVHLRLTRGRFYREHAGVYSIGRPAHSPLERAAAAVLACGPNGGLSHEGGLMLWGWGSQWPARFDVTLVKGDRRPRGITVHRPKGLTPADITRQHGIPCTSPARTILDCLPRTPPQRRTRLVQDALLTPYLTRAALVDVAQRFPRHLGASPLAHLLDAGVTRSPKEDEFLAFCARYDLPTPLTERLVAGHLVDALFPEHRVIVELDGWETHRERWSFESDRDRDADTLAADHVTVRVTHRRMDGQPEAEARRLKTILAARISGLPTPGGD